MKADNPFDTKLDTHSRIPEDVRGALIDTIDSLDFCWAGVQAVFGAHAKPEHAIAVLPTVMAQLAASRAASENPAPPTA